MGKYVEVFLSILCDEETVRAQKLQACTRVQQQLATLGIRSSHIINNKGVADITAIAEWNEAEIQGKLAQIRAIHGVKSVEARILVPA
jgi:hypothetical protein